MPVCSGCSVGQITVVYSIEVVEVIRIRRSSIGRSSRNSRTFSSGCSGIREVLAGSCSIDERKTVVLSHVQINEAGAKQDQHLFVRQWVVCALSPLSVPACPVGRCLPLLSWPLLLPTTPRHSRAPVVVCLLLALGFPLPRWWSRAHPQLPRLAGEGLQRVKSLAVRSSTRACARGRSMWRR